MDDNPELRFLVVAGDDVRKAVVGVQSASRHLTMATGDNFDQPDKSHWFRCGMEALAQGLNTLGYDMVKRPDVERLVPRQFPDDGGEADARSMGCQNVEAAQ